MGQSSCNEKLAGVPAVAAAEVALDLEVRALSSDVPPPTEPPIQVTGFLADRRVVLVSLCDLVTEAGVVPEGLRCRIACASFHRFVANSEKHRKKQSEMLNVPGVGGAPRPCRPEEAWPWVPHPPRVVGVGSALIKGAFEPRPSPLCSSIAPRRTQSLWSDSLFDAFVRGTS